MERYCAFMKKIGIDDVCCMLGNPDVFPLAVKTNVSAAKEARLIAEDSGVRILEVAGAGDLKENISAAKEMGGEYYRICEIIPDTPEEKEKFSSYLKQSGKVAADFGMKVVVENHGGLLTKAVTCKEILEELAMSNVTLNYDPANFLHYGEDPLMALDHLIPLIGFAHFKNLKHIDGGVEFCRLKDGEIDYSKILDKFLPHYDGVVCLEYERAEDAEQGTSDDLLCLKRLLEKYA
jgi:sugar phosphate isomerase/epimerase